MKRCPRCNSIMNIDTWPKTPQYVCPKCKYRESTLADVIKQQEKAREDERNRFIIPQRE